MSRVHLLKRLRGQTWGASQRKMKQFYAQFVRPVMKNGFTYSATGKKTAINKLRIVQNAAMRTILKAPPRTSIKEMEKKTGLQDI